MGLQRPLLSLAIMAAMLIELTMAATYTVGGPNGSWDTSTKLQNWASSQTFLVGDSLSKLIKFYFPILNVTYRLKPSF